MHTIVKSVTEKVKLSQMSMGQKLLYGGILVAGLAVAAPVIALAVAGVTSLFKLVVVGVSLFALLLLLPVGDRWLRVQVLKMLKANARANPIETLELDYQLKAGALQKFVAFVKQMIAAHRVSQDELNQLKKDFPDRDLSERQEMMDLMKRAVDVLRSKAETADNKLKLYGDEIRFIKADHAWSKRAGAALAQMRTIEGADALGELLKGEAIGQVRQDVAESFAELDMLLQQDEGTKQALQLAHAQDNTIPQSFSFNQLQPVGQAG